MSSTTDGDGRALGMAEMTTSHDRVDEAGTRRDFLFLLTGATVAVGTAALIWPLIDNMNPSADVLALASTEVDLSGVEEGMRITVKWRGKPVFVDHRTQEEIEEARAVPVDELRDPQTDADRVIEPQWLVVVGVCTHLGCVPLGQKPDDPRGDYGGWFCPCHGSHYDTSGRIRRGPAPRNLAVPDYAFTDESMIRIG
jgi:ubiquinol-cytochrome c reductase iron-sulfur subunit